MHADLKGYLSVIDKVYMHFEHNGALLSKEQVRKLLEYGLSKGYKTTADLSDLEIDTVLGIDTQSKTN